MPTPRLAAAVATAAVAATLMAPALAAADASSHQTGLATTAAQGGHLSAIGLTTDQRLVEFRVHTPSKPWSLGKVTGLAGDRKLVGIDFRVQNGRLYGVGDRGGIYTLSTRNAKATKVSQLTVALSGMRFGVDFNPAANRLRVISDTGQNLRHNIDDPAAPLTTTVDGTLTNPTTPPSTALGVTGAAYTNNDLNAATATSLFDIDTTGDRVSLQSPANAGTLAPPATSESTPSPPQDSTSTTRPRRAPTRATQPCKRPAPTVCTRSTFSAAAPVATGPSRPAIRSSTSRCR